MIQSVLHLPYRRDDVYAVLSDFANYRLWLPGCTVSNVLSASGDQTLLELTTDGLKLMEMRFEVEAGRSVRFTMVKGRELKTYAGLHRLEDSSDGKGTVVFNEVEVDAGVLVPRFLVDRIGHHILDEMGRSLGERVHATADGGRAAAARPLDIRREPRRILQVADTPEGRRIWYRGRVYVPKQ